MPKREDIKKIMVIGSGPIVIGQAAEFDYSGSQACKALKEEGYQVVLVNSNPATIMTDPQLADRVYVEPLVLDVVAEIIKKEKPNAILPTLGGQTALNLAAELWEAEILQKESVELLGATFEAIQKAEDRSLFKKAMEKIKIAVPESDIAHSAEEAAEIAERIGYPVIIRPAYTLGGTGGGIANHMKELHKVVKKALPQSRINQVLVEQSLIGWKEYELEVMRDQKDSVVVICTIENIDPMGIHTGDSITCAPAQTLTNKEYQTLRDASIRIIREIGVETGGSNIQFAVHPKTSEYVSIEMNPRVSRSSALASKATGFPIAKMAAKLAIGLTLDEIPNDITKETYACFEPTLDYVVVKIPRWPFDKFRDADRVIGTQMKATGEVMAVGRTFEEALQKAIRSLDIKRYGLGADGEHEPITDAEELRNLLKNPTDMRIFHVRDAIAMGMSIGEIYDLTKIDKWFLYKIKNIVSMEKKLRKLSLDDPDVYEAIKEAKKLGFSDLQLAHILNSDEIAIRELRKKKGIKAAYKMVDTCAAEFEAQTPYYYSSYEREDESVSSRKKKVIIIGGGPIRIGQGIEFDYCTVHAVLALREEGIEVIIINNNPETVSTDFDISNKLYFEPLTFEDVMNVIEKENPYGVMVQFGGQTPINLAVPLWRAGVPILGTSPDNIDIAEDRDRFRRLLNKLGIPQAESGIARSIEEAREVVNEIGYPSLVRPSYVLGGRAMEIIYDQKELDMYIGEAVKISSGHPILIDRFLQPAIELDVDATSDGRDVFIGGIMEHIEHAGVHSGDSACVVPPQSLDEETIETVKDYTIRLARELEVNGLINIQYAVKDRIVHVLEVNPRASRTVPFISKATGIPLAKLAAKTMIGYSLEELGYKTGMPSLDHVAIKEVVFPFIKLPGVDPVLGPEMKSTGESMGIDVDFGKAFYKAQLGANMLLPARGNVFITVKERDRVAIVPIAQKLQKMGFSIFATDGTAEALGEGNVRAKEVLKVSEGRPNVVDYMKSGKISLVINTPSRKKEAKRDGYVIRRNAVELNIPYITTIAGAKASVEAIENIRTKDITIKSLQEYYGG